MKNNRRPWWSLVFIIIIVAVSVLIDIPKGPNLNWGQLKKEFTVKRGLDLQGGTHLVYEADLEKIDKSEQNQAIEGALDVMRKRVDALGVSEPNIQTTNIGDKKGILVELPGIRDVDQATKIIGQTAELKFITETGEEVVTGKDLRRANVNFANSGADSGIQVALEFNEEGAKKFAAATEKNIGKRIIILLDNEPIQTPTVQTAIPDGKAVITGYNDVQSARNIALQLNSGALPVPLKLIEQRNVGATLGDKPVKESMVAGLVGFIAIAVFMIAIYKVPGFLATLALFIYSLIVLALFKFIPVTITLAGITGYILSVGVAVDANILIFERMREEIRRGKSLPVALEDGFRRAWASIRDSNLSSLITALILIWFGSGLIRGFALTLAIGILVSMFTAITVSRTFLRLLLRSERFSKLARI